MSVRLLRPTFFAAALALSLVACGSNQKKEVQYQTATVDQGSIVARVSSTGTLSALVTVQVGSQVSGRIKSLFADYNDKVKKSQLLAEIDPALYKAAWDNARANRIAAEATLAGARVQAANAKLTFDRNTQLVQRGIVAQADFDTAKAAFDAATAGVDAAAGALEQAKAQESQSQLNLGYTEIISPINGIVISRNVDVGQTVAASLQAPILFLIAEDLKKMQVDTRIRRRLVGLAIDGKQRVYDGQDLICFADRRSCSVRSHIPTWCAVPVEFSVRRRIVVCPNTSARVTALFRYRLPLRRRSIYFGRRHQLGNNGADAGVSSSRRQFNIQCTRMLALAIMAGMLAPDHGQRGGNWWERCLSLSAPRKLGAYL